MNLKEAFRYQNFLEDMMHHAEQSIKDVNHCLTVTKIHFRSKSNPEAADIIEMIETDKAYGNDDVLALMNWLINERYRLTQAINKAKMSSDIDLDAAIEANKFRQQTYRAVQAMLRHMPGKSNEKGYDYKFNAEGNQITYYYDIEIDKAEAYDKVKAKVLMRDIITSSDRTSTEIDGVLISAKVDYEPKYDVNDSFDDVMEMFTGQ